MNVTMWYKVEQLTISDDGGKVRVKLREESDYGFQIVNRQEPHIVGPSETWFELEIDADDNDLKLGDIVKLEASIVLELRSGKLKDNKCEFIPPVSSEDKKDPSTKRSDDATEPYTQMEDEDYEDHRTAMEFDDLIDE